MKLRKLKTWYTLEAAAARLSQLSDELIGIRDVFQFIADGHLQPSMLLDDHIARPIVPSGAPNGDMNFVQHPEGGRTNEFAFWKFKDDSWTIIEGLHTIDIRDNESKKVLRSLLTTPAKPYTSILLETIVINKNGDAFQLLERKTQGEIMIYTRDGVEGELEVFHAGLKGCKPVPFMPEMAEIIVSALHLDEFENEFISDPPDNGPVIQREKKIWDELALKTLLLEATTGITHTKLAKQYRVSRQFIQKKLKHARELFDSPRKANALSMSTWASKK